MKIDKESFIVNHKVNSSDSGKFYTKIGLEDYVDDLGYPRLKDENNEHVYAKCTKDRKSKHFKDTSVVNRYSFYIITDPSKTIYNPIKLHTIEPNIKKSFINQVCKSNLKFTEVSESIFNKYLNFLATENIQWLNHAQREIK
jgi:hypothetical protein